jgi:Acetyltransferase (GNAT) domain
VSVRAHELFAAPWWLDAVTGGGWEEVRAELPDGSAGRLPFVRRRQLGLTALSQPALTPTLGPRLTGLPERTDKRLGAEKKLMTELIARLPSHDVFSQGFTPALTNWLPFHWAGFQATVRYTYRLPAVDDPERLWGGLSSDHRRKVRRAARELEVRHELDVGRLYELAAGTLRGKGVAIPYDHALLARIDRAGARRDARRVLAAADPAGRVLAAVLLVWDDDWVYYLLGGRDPEADSTGALRLLQWEGVRLAASLERGFDFEGSMVEDVERVFRGFGAEQVPYLHVSRVSARAAPLWALRRRVRSRR